MLRRTAGFTLLEICLAIFILLLMLGVAIAYSGDLFASRRLDEKWHDFDRFVRRAQERAVKERKPYVLVWGEEGIALEPGEIRSGEEPEEIEMFSFDGATIELDRPAALEKKPAAEWYFWRSGVCEPVFVHYAGPDGAWSAEYNALSARGRLVGKEGK